MIKKGTMRGVKIVLGIALIFYGIKIISSSIMWGIIMLVSGYFLAKEKR